jgi:hypothetical protein
MTKLLWDEFFWLLCIPSARMRTFQKQRENELGGLAAEVDPERWFRTRELGLRIRKQKRAEDSV